MKTKREAVIFIYDDGVWEYVDEGTNGLGFLLSQQHRFGTHSHVWPLIGHTFGQTRAEDGQRAWSIGQLARRLVGGYIMDWRSLLSRTMPNRGRATSLSFLRSSHPTLKYTFVFFLLKIGLLGSGTWVCLPADRRLTLCRAASFFLFFPLSLIRTHTLKLGLN